MEARLNLLDRLMSLACAVALLWPASWWIHMIGLAVLVLLFLKSFRASRKADLAAGLRG